MPCHAMPWIVGRQGAMARPIQTDLGVRCRKCIYRCRQRNKGSTTRVNAACGAINGVSVPSLLRRPLVSRRCHISLKTRRLNPIDGPGPRWTSSDRHSMSGSILRVQRQHSMDADRSSRTGLHCLRIRRLGVRISSGAYQDVV
jgi:hypothetical protein